MLVMAAHRYNRVHLSKQIDLMAKVSSIGFVAPALDPRNAGANAVGGEGDDVSDVAVVGICAARAAESKGNGVGGVPLLEPHVTDAVEGKGRVDGDRALRKRARTEDY
jgi:hypothetical protein